MFRGRMKAYSIEKPIVKDDGLGFEYTDYEKPSTGFLYIAKPFVSDSAPTEIYTQRYEATAFSFDSFPLGSRIDESWTIESVDEIKQQFVYGLSKIGLADG